MNPTTFEPTIRDLKGFCTVDDTMATVAGMDADGDATFIPICPKVDTEKTNGVDFLFVPRMLQAATALINKARHPVVSSALAVAK